jgi:predicted NAD/FAD-binding protein
VTAKRIAVIGAGVSGIVAAHYLAREHEITLFEAEDRLGGHTNTINVPEGPDAGLPVDTGFIVFNENTYPNLIRFFAELGIRGEPTDMSFSYSDESRKFAYAGTGLSGLFANRALALCPGYWMFLASVVRFNRRALSDLNKSGLEGMTIGEYLGHIGSSGRLSRDYLGPMTQAIWSAPGTDALSYPAASFIRFFNNHGLLSMPGKIKWLYLKGGSNTYVDAFAKRFPGKIRLAAPVRDVRRHDQNVTVCFDGGEEEFDAVVIAAHADQALGMLHDADEHERAALKPWRYSPNRTVLHSDELHMPSNHRAWACWNVTRHQGDDQRRPVRVTYWMNRLQRLEAQQNWLVSLNADQEFAPGSTAYETVYEHPVYDLASVAAQKLLPEISGRRRTYFCGAYHGYGFHEDGARSGVDVVTRHFGVTP